MAVQVTQVKQKVLQEGLVMVLQLKAELVVQMWVKKMMEVARVD